MRDLVLPLLLLAGLAPGLARADAVDLSALLGTTADPFDVMHFLSRRDLHDVADERWNAYGQLTYISSWKLPFQAGYTNLNGSTNSLLPSAEQSFTLSATLYLGVKLWPGAEAYFGPEVIAERPLSQLRGIGGSIQNFELQKTGGEAPAAYRSRIFLRQTIGLGGSRVAMPSSAMQLGMTVDSRRIVLTVGNFSVLDVFDKNTFNSNTRQQFLNMAFMTHAAWDFASDARGYSWGGTAEIIWDDWSLRFAHMSPPINPNTLPVGLATLDRYFGQQIEFAHAHSLLGQPGVVRVVAYRNREIMGRFDDAIAAFQADPRMNATTCEGFNYGSQNAGAPDLCWARKPNLKMGIGLNLEQRLTKELGVFFRGMYSDGETEVQAYTSSDRAISGGALSQGALWHRPADLVGIGAAVAWISRTHGEYLRLGGIDGFIGDGNLRQAPEAVFELFYSLNLLRVLWLSLDYQFLMNPAFNADRGPVHLFGLRLHAEF